MATTFDTTIRFLNDAVGLERLLRLFQSLILLLRAYPVFLSALLRLQHAPYPLNLLNLLVDRTVGPPPGPGNGDPLSTSSPKTAAPPPSSLPLVPTPDEAHAALTSLNRDLNIVRRFLRVFKFLESFRGAWELQFASSQHRGAPLTKPPPSSSPSSSTLNTTTTSQGKQQQRRGKWQGLRTQLLISAKTFTGFYLLLESFTLLNVIDVPGLRPLEAGTSDWIDTSALKFWFLGLAASAAATTLEVCDKFFYSRGARCAEGSSGVGLGADSPGPVEGEDEKKAGGGIASPEIRGGGGDMGNSTETLFWSLFDDVLRLSSDLFDITLPGTAVGWLEIDGGLVAWAMLGSTILTSIEVWKRCRREVMAANA